MSRLFHLPDAAHRDHAIEVWMHQHDDDLGAIAHHWFEVLRSCGDDVREVLHDGHPTACVGTAAFAYVNAFKAHVDVGFFHGAELVDANGLLEGTGKFMRHVKVRIGDGLDTKALKDLIETAFADVKQRLAAENEPD